MKIRKTKTMTPQEEFPELFTPEAEARLARTGLFFDRLKELGAHIHMFDNFADIEAVIAGAPMRIIRSKRTGKIRSISVWQDITQTTNQHK